MKKIIVTKDGSHTILHLEINQHYHSVNGAISESKHVFIKEGLLNTKKETINLLEIGLGTGLNALLTLQILKKKKKYVKYVALEPFPLKLDIVKKLNYCQLLKEENSVFLKIHTSLMDNPTMILENFILLKHKKTLEEMQFNNSFDLVYFDAFSPSVQKNIWEEKIFIKLFNSMSNNSILVTYCCKGEVKRKIERAGFIVKKLPGPPGKREMIFARKKN